MSNTNGDAFDTGWAICFNVNEDGTALTPSTDCDIDGNDDEAYSLEVSWKLDVGKSFGGSACTTDEWDRDQVRITQDVPIEDNSFQILGDLISQRAIIGVFDADTATGTARLAFSTGMSAGLCELDGGWTAAPAQ